MGVNLGNKSRFIIKDCIIKLRVKSCLKKLYILTATEKLLDTLKKKNTDHELRLYARILEHRLEVGLCSCTILAYVRT